MAWFDASDGSFSALVPVSQRPGGDARGRWIIDGPAPGRRQGCRPTDPAVPPGTPPPPAPPPANGPPRCRRAARPASWPAGRALAVEPDVTVQVVAESARPPPAPASRAFTTRRNRSGSRSSRPRANAAAIAHRPPSSARRMSEARTVGGVGGLGRGEGSRTARPARARRKPSMGVVSAPQRPSPGGRGRNGWRTRPGRRRRSPRPARSR